MPSPRVVTKRKKTGALLVDLRGLADSEKKPGAVVTLANGRLYKVAALNSKTATLVPVAP